MAIRSSAGEDIEELFILIFLGKTLAAIRNLLTAMSNDAINLGHSLLEISVIIETFHLLQRINAQVEDNRHRIIDHIGIVTPCIENVVTGVFDQLCLSVVSQRNSMRLMLLSKLSRSDGFRRVAPCEQTITSEFSPNVFGVA